jgi:hypothetical protein
MSPYTVEVASSQQSKLKHLDEKHAIEEAAQKQCIVAYYDD